MAKAPAAALAALAGLLLARGAALRAEDAGPLGWFIPTIRPLTLGVTAGFFAEPERSTSAPTGDFGQSGGALGLRTQPWRDAGSELQLSLSARTVDVLGGPVLPSTGAIPDRFYDLSLGTLYRHVEADGTIWGASVALGTVSDQPLRGRSSVALNATAFWRIPSGPEQAWILFVNEGSDRAFANFVPIPGVAWQYNHGTELNLLLGVPFLFARWAPNAWFSTSVGGSVFGNARLGAAVVPAPTSAAWLSLTADYVWSTETWRRADRDDARDRIFVRESRALGGLAASLGPPLRATVQYGWAFGRRIREGTSWNHAEGNGIDVAAGAIFSAGVSSSF